MRMLIHGMSNRLAEKIPTIEISINIFIGLSIPTYGGLIVFLKIPNTVKNKIKKYNISAKLVLIKSRPNFIS